MVLALFLDHAGQLWIGTSRHGLIRVPDPASDNPHFVAYTIRQGLSSNYVRSITEDQRGRIYFWTGRGVDRLEPATSGIRHYTSADGLVPAGPAQAFRDNRGRLWFGYVGLSRLDPEADRRDPSAPPIRITGLRVRGVAQPLSELGESNHLGLVLEPSQNQIDIDFASLNFGVGEVLRYQYKLEPSDGGWGPLRDLRTVNYVQLRPGTYRFLVRAIDGDGVPSSSPAALSFRVLAPVWQRRWFLSLVAAALAFLVYGLHRYRVAQLLAVERIRTRIAGDLHDDIGAGLSQIAILSEVVKREMQPQDSKPGKLLDHIASVSGELVDSMSEIVWAINPRGDTLEALVQRMRRFASDVLSSRDIEFDFRVLPPDHRAGLRADIRRHTFLIFKEAITNAARHASCTRVSASLSFDKHQMALTVRDDGCGFECHGTGNGQHGGHGLSNLQRRAMEMGARIEIVSGQGAGTHITLHAPLARQRFSRFRHSTTT